MAEFIERTLEELPPEVSNDICDQGIMLTGGGALLHKLDQELAKRVGVPFKVSDNPLHCVVRGSAMLLENIEGREHLLIRP